VVEGYRNRAVELETMQFESESAAQVRRNMYVCMYVCMYGMRGGT
jgi:hypothetical protein